MSASVSIFRQLKPVEALNPELQTRGSKHWKSRAEEARAVAAQMSDDLSRQTMENIAASYDKLAGWAEKQGR
jgi:hypothetical protein